MEVRSDIFDTIIDYVKRSKAEKLECEAVLKHKIDTQKFTELLQYFNSSKNFKRYVYPDNTEDSLDIIAKIDGNNIRTTLLSSEAIKTYCVSGEIPDNSEMITKTQMAQHTSLSDYYFRVNLKSEQPIVDDKAKYIKELKQSLKVFRLKRRFSFIDSANNFRIDLTIVKSNGMNPVKSFLRSNVMQAQEMYEVEIEYLNTDIADKACVEQLLKYMLVVLRVVFNTKSVIKQSESHTVMINYLRLVNPEFLSRVSKKYSGTAEMITELLRFPNKIFFSYNPVTLELQNINTDDIVQNDNVLSDEANYSVTEKADGERNILFIADNQKVYLINNRFFIIDTGFTSTRVNTLIDGELIRKDKSGNDYNVFMCFDMYFDKGKDVRELQFISQEYKKTADDRYNLLRENIKSLSGNSIFKVDVKKFFTRDRDVKKRAKIAGKNLLQIANEYIWKERNILFPYNIDGLIFQPTKLGVGAIYQNEVIEYRFGGSWNKVYKWKPPEDNTIDMMIEFKITDKAMIDGFVSCKLYVNDNTKMQNIDPLNIANGIYEIEMSGSNNSMRQFRECKLPLKDGNIISGKDEIISDRDIVEFAYNDDDSVDELHKWIPNKIRKDKTELYKKTRKIDGTANSYMTAMNVWKSIKNPVTDAMITGEKQVTNEIANYDDDIYSMRNVDRLRFQMKPLMNFHNEYVKNRHLIGRFKSKRFSLFDIGCGKGSDMAKYVDRGQTTGFKLVVGADQSFDSILGASDSAWSRYLTNITNVEKYKQFNPKKNPMIFIQLNGKKKWNGDYFKTLNNDKLRFMTQVLWDMNVPDNIPEYNTPFVKQYIGQVKKGFDVVNCQFAIHYFFENAETLDTFCKNINSVLKVGGYFIGTCFDGDRVNGVFEAEKKDTVIRQKNNNVMWMIRKKYTDKDPMIGRKIDVFVESINQVLEEYLVYFDILKAKLKEFNINVLSEEEMKEFELSASHGSFDKIYNDNVDDPNFKDKMDDTMKEYSFLNEWFIFKKN